MKVAYWPGCVSRGFTPELHGSMAKVAPLLDIELVELDRACCTGAIADLLPLARCAGQEELAQPRMQLLVHALIA